MMTLDEAIKIAKKNGNPQLAEWLDELRYYRLFVDRYLKVTEPKYAGLVVCDGKKFVCANPILKTRDQEGYCSFYGFREIGSEVDRK